MDPDQKQDLLAYYWHGEPVYHPAKEKPVPRGVIVRTRFLAVALLMVYLLFSRQVVISCGASGLPLWVWFSGILAGAFVADFLSGLTHVYIDFGTSNRKNVIHKHLFLSRVHHHELMRPARLNYAALWFFPALSSFLVLALPPALLFKLMPRSDALCSLGPFWLSVLWNSSVSQLSHAFAHGKAKARFSRTLVSLLQRYRVLIPPETHLRHHRLIDRNFCVLNGWANPLLNRVFKRWIEGKIAEDTSPARQKSDMKKKLSYPYEEIL